MPPRRPTALIAEDEPLLALALQQALAQAWPELWVLATVGDGESAVQQALSLRPDVLLLDIRMPGLSGLEAATELADAWPEDLPFPALVFVTAYDQYAVQAFETQAVDYVLKPVQAARLARTVLRVQQALQRHPTQSPSEPLQAAVAQLRELLANAPGMARDAGARPPLTVIPASRGNTVHMVPIDEVLVFEAADKYVRVLTAHDEWLIRTPLKELTVQLPPEVFWQIHRGTLVRARAIRNVHRDNMGKLLLTVQARPEHWPVSRLYAHLFKAM